MAYLVLARKYRPKKFSEVIGQFHTVKILTNALKAGKLSHALLFSGIKGSGKTTVARIVAKALNCKNLEDGYEPCNKCIHCEEINKGIYVDVIEIDAASNRGIDQIRELIENVKFAPAKGKAKVYIIDEAHMLTKEASNALLKTLEEPPSHVYFILATTEPNKLLPTILSRCQRYDFRRIETVHIIKFLKEICKKEGYEIEDSALELIAVHSYGSLRDALSFLDQIMAYGCKTKNEIIQAFGWHENILVEELAEALLRKDVKKTFEIVEEIYAKGLDIIFFVEKLMQFFRELILMKSFQKDRGFTFSLSTLRSLSLDYTKEEIFLIFQMIAKDLEIIKRSDYPQIHFEICLMKICEFEKFTPINEILTKLEKIINSNIGFEIQKEEKEEKQEKQEKQKEQEQPKTWDAFLEFVKREKSPSLYAFLETQVVPKMEDNQIFLEIQNGNDNIHSIKVIEELIRSFFQKPVKIEIKEKEKRKESSFLEEVKKRKEVKEIQEVFKVKILHVEQRSNY